MNIDTYSQKIGAGNLVVVGLICVIIFLMSINFSEGVSSDLNEDKEHNIIITGKINSTLKSDDENTSWLLSGTWKSNLFTNVKFNYTNSPKFSAKINMVMANGSSPHTHKISHFTLTNVSTQDHSKVYEGYLAVGTNLGPVFAIPASIKNYENKTISISLKSLDDITLDQTKVVNHFESKQIFGVFAK